MINNLSQYFGFDCTINTGESCNLACKYCYETNKKPKIQTFENAKAFIDRLLEDDNPANIDKTVDIMNGGLILDFIGGDALMFPELLDKTIQYFLVKATLLNSKWKHRFRISISTNGTLFENENVRKFVEKYRDVLSLGVSIDGCPEYHNRNRVFPDGKGSIEIIKKWWGWYIGIFGESGRQTKSTLNKDAIPYLLDNLKYMHEVLGIKYINQNFIFEDMGLNDDDLMELDKQLKLCADYVLEHREDLYWSMIDDRFNNPKSYEEDIKERPNKGWCGSGSMPALSPDGNIYPCFRFLPVSFNDESNKEYIVGNIKDGFNKKENFEKVRSYTRENISPGKCKQCEIESVCSWCIAGAIANEGAPIRQTNLCEVMKLQVKWAKYYWSKYKEIEK